MLNPKLLADGVLFTTRDFGILTGPGTLDEKKAHLVAALKEQLPEIAGDAGLDAAAVKSVDDAMLTQAVDLIAGLLYPEAPAAPSIPADVATVDAQGIAHLAPAPSEAEKVVEAAAPVVEAVAPAVEAAIAPEVASVAQAAEHAFTGVLGGLVGEAEHLLGH